MFRVKVCVLGTLSMLMVIAVNGVGASPAFANFELTVTPCTGGKEIDMCWSEKEKATELFELKGEEEFIFTQSGTMVTKGTIGSSTVEIVCEGTKDSEEKVKQTNPETENDKTAEKQDYTGCKLSGELSKKCKVATEKETDELTTSPGTSDVEDDTKPMTGTALIEFPIENNGTETCPATVKGSHPVTGKTICDWEKEVEVMLSEHSLECKGDSGLLLSEKEAEYLVVYKVKPKNDTTGVWSVDSKA